MKPNDAQGKPTGVVREGDLHSDVKTLTSSIMISREGEQKQATLEVTCTWDSSGDPHYGDLKYHVEGRPDLRLTADEKDHLFKAIKGLPRSDDQEHRREKGGLPGGNFDASHPAASAPDVKPEAHQTKGTKFTTDESGPE